MRPARGRPRGERRASDDGRRARDGFILLDVVLAMAVLAMIAAVAWPLVAPATSPARLAAYAEEAGALIEEDRLTAHRLGAPVATRIDPIARRLLGGARGRLLRLPGDVALDAVTTADCLGDTGVVELRFSVDGRSCGLALALIGPRGRSTIAVDWLTGAVVVKGGGRG